MWNIAVAKLTQIRRAEIKEKESDVNRNRLLRSTKQLHDFLAL